MEKEDKNTKEISTDTNDLEIESNNNSLLNTTFDLQIILMKILFIIKINMMKIYFQQLM